MKPGNKRPKQSNYHAPGHHAGLPKKKSLALPFIFSVILWIAVAAMSLNVALSCVGNDGLYIVELRSNQTTPVSVRFGYFGTCVSTTGNNNNGNSNDQADGVNFAACISYSDFDEDEDPASQFLGKIADDANGGHTSLPAPDVLNNLLTISSRLQGAVFPAAVPICFIVTFLLSAFVFWILVPLSGRTKAYKTIFAATTLINSYGLMLGFMAAYATRLACQGLILPSSGDTGLLQPDVYVTQGGALQARQWIAVAISCCLQLSIAFLFIRRRAVGGDVQIILIPYIGKRRCCC